MKFLITLVILLGTIKSFTQMTSQGSTTGACDTYTITNNTNQKGAIWSPSTIDLSNPFDFNFEVNLGCTDAFGADGLVFVLQANPTGMGNIGNGMGYANYVGNPTPISTNSIGVEIDTWDSNPAVPTDINSDHIGMNSAGLNSHDVVAPIAIPNIEDCLPHTFQITWNPGTLNFEVILDGNSIFVYNGDLVTNFFAGNPNVYFGWTGGTGGAMNVQTVTMHRNASFTPDQTVVCIGQAVNFTDNSTSDLNMITNWNWNFGDGNTSTVQNPSHAYAAAGTYVAQLTITDISGCTDVVTTNITVSPGLTINMSQQDISCFGLNDGQATATPTNGTGPYGYQWDDALSQTTQTAVNLTNIAYNVVVTDANGCTGNGTVTIAEPSQLQFASIPTVDASCGISNGSITINETGGTAGYQYSIDGGVTQQGGNTFNGLAANNYNVEIEDANGCTVSQVVTLNSNSAMSLDNLSATDEVCGQADGTITVSVSAGTMPYQYSLDAGVTYQASNVFNGLTGGNYVVQIIDANNCIVTGNITVNSPTTLSIDLTTPTDPTCNGYLDGQISVSVSGGTGPYTYSSDNGATFQAGSTLTGLGANNYTIIVQDATGCQVNGNSLLTDPPVVQIDNVVVVEALCAGSSDGTMTITSSGGAGGYVYSIDGGASFQPSNLFAGLSASNYNVQVNDMNGCFATSVEIVNEPLPLQIDNVVVTDVTCNGLSDGAIDIQVSQGTAPYTYSIDNVTFQPSSIFNGISGGTINLFAQDVNGCQVTGTAFIGESQPLIVNLPIDTTICDGGTANICPSIQGGTAPYTFSWNGIFGGNTPCLSAPVAGIYNVLVTDANGCDNSANPISQEVIVNPPITANVNSNSTICAGDLIQLNADAVGGNGGPYTYVWTNDVDGTILTGAIQQVNPTTNTTYTVTVNDGCSLPVSLPVVITTYPVPQIDISPSLDEGCLPLQTVFTNNSDPSLVASTYWDFGNGNTLVATASTLTQNYTSTGCFDIYVEITTIDGCLADSTFTNLICVYDNPSANFSFSPDEVDILDPTINFQNESNNASLYSWSFGDGGISTDTNPEHVYNGNSAQTYTVGLAASNDFGCSDSITKTITIKEVIQFYIPNAFTPNGDSFNPGFLPVFMTGFTPQNYYLRIFNRWGNLLFVSQNPAIGWDGTYGGKIVLEDTYVWQIEFIESQTDMTHMHTGHVTVLK